jgi:hypothetical protein
MDRGNEMKRGFLFGIGSFLIVGIITGLGLLLSQDFLGGGSLELICIPLSVVIIRAAKSAPPNRSRLNAAVWWLIGFFGSGMAILAVFGAGMFVHLPAK